MDSVLNLHCNKLQLRQTGTYKTSQILQYIDLKWHYDENNTVRVISCVWCYSIFLYYKTAERFPSPHTSVWFNWSQRAALPSSCIVGSWQRPLRDSRPIWGEWQNSLLSVRLTSLQTMTHSLMEKKGGEEKDIGVTPQHQSCQKDSVCVCILSSIAIRPKQLALSCELVNCIWQKTESEKQN